MQYQLHYFAPAKINLFLHILGRNPNGYHELQTIFQRISWGDELYFSKLEIPEITITTNLIENIENNLVYKAARLLQETYQVNQGVAIKLEKNLPTGAGLGGGSSDAGATLRALNKLWNLNLSTEGLIDLGKQLGADVPIFVLDQNAWAEGIGEKLTPITLSPQWYVLLYPNVHANTKLLFNHPDLPRSTPRINPENYHFEQTHNDFENLVCELYPEAASARTWLKQFGAARMTGSGSSFFLPVATEEEGLKIKAQAPDKWLVAVCRGL